jgi:hypothetical protein
VLPSARGGSLYHTIYEDYWFRLTDYAGLMKEDETNPEPGHRSPYFTSMPFGIPARQC